MDHAHEQHPTKPDEAPDSAELWNRRYAEKVWSGNPNQALVAEVRELTTDSGRAPGRALDVCCGEGADVVWLAQQGWQATGIDISEAGIARARTAAERAGVQAEFLVGDFDQVRIEGSFQLVTAMYPVLRRLPQQATERRLLNLVGVGGSLVFVHHADNDAHHPGAMRPEDFIGVDDIACMAVRLPGWQLVADETRERRVASGRGSGHHLDRIVRARRLV